MKQVKPKKCRECKDSFKPRSSLQVVCSPVCAMKYARKQQEKKEKDQAIQERRKIKERKEAIKSTSELLREAQQAFNAYIRERDKYEPCISCGRPNDGSHQRHASHFRSVKSSPQLRFNVFNVHASCASCNTYLSGNLLSYRERLPKKIGRHLFDHLSCNNESVRYTKDYAKRVKMIFNKKKNLYQKLFRSHNYD